MIEIVDNVILLGTSHVAKQSVQEIKEIIAQYQPEVVGIELDLGRLRRLLSNSKEKSKSFDVIKEVGLGGYLFLLLGSYVQQRIGKSLGIDPGVDMKAAYQEARKNKIPTSLIDQEITAIAKKISVIPFTKKIGMFSNLFIKSFKKEYRDQLNFDVKQGVPDQKVIEKAIEIIKKEVPALYKILIHDRNKYMVDNILRLREVHTSGYILAVVGAGHVKGMKELLEKKMERPDISFSFTID